MRRLFSVLGVAVLVLAGCRRQAPKSDLRNLKRVDTTGSAFGSYLRVLAAGKNEAAIRRAVDSVFVLCDYFNRLWSPFSESSEVNRLNRAGRLKVSEHTRRLIEQGLEFSRRTNGAFDITVAPLMRLWGFRDRRFRVPLPAEVEAVRSFVGYERVRLGPGNEVFLEPGMELDLGGIAVGYALDRVVELLKRKGVEVGLVDAGGDIAVFGDFRAAIGVQNPRSEGVERVVMVRDAVVATSGDYQQFFEVEGRRYSHIMDPRTGYPAARCVAVTVKAPTAVEADVYSTALFVMGPDEARDWLESHPEVAAIFYVVSGDSLQQVEFGVWSDSGAGR
ncbi:MAG: FAD:protein FMN transferase [candidate division WOR-3 bacterium]|nr:FAD:protein FMN transferase [candidate division WOR-3 bacterium]